MNEGKNGRPCLTWPGKTERHSREVLPLCVQETHGQADSREGQWRNMLIRADNLPVLSSLCYGPLRKTLEAHGGVKLIYCDPPFAVGNDFTLPVAENKAGPQAHVLAYRDQWQDGLSGFLCMMHERLLLMRELLAPDGSLFLHSDWRAAPYLRLVLDEVFGPERFLGDIVWHYTGGGRSKRWFSRKHDRILHYAASNEWHFNPDAVRVPYKPTSGYAKGGITSAAGKHYSPNPLGTPPDDVWDIPMVNPLARERCGYPTQKPLALPERIILASSRPGDLVADFFCGSGTTAVCAERLGRAWIAVDSGAPAIQAGRKRFAAGPACSSVPRSETPRQGKCAPYILVCPEGSAAQAKKFPEASFRHTAVLSGGAFDYEIREICLKIHRKESGFSLSLEGFSAVLVPAHAPDQAAADKPAGQGKKQLSPAPDQLFTEDWATLLDYWSVGILPADLHLPEGLRPAFPCPEIVWESCRDKKTGPLLRSPFLNLPAGHDSEAVTLVVNLVDIFFNESRVLLAVG